MEYECIGCGDTGINSRGGVCVPCQSNGRTFLSDAVSCAIAEAFRDKPVPRMEELVDILRWAYRPRVTYGACFRGDGGEVGVFEGPHRTIEECMVTPPVACDMPAYIVEFIRRGYNEEPHVRPVAMWHGMRWRLRKQNT